MKKKKKNIKTKVDNNSVPKKQNTIIIKAIDD